MSEHNQPYLQDASAPLEKEYRNRVDLWVLLAMFGLLLIGIFAVYSTSYYEWAMVEPRLYLYKQMRFVFYGLIAVALLAFGLDYHSFRMRGISNVLIAGTILLLCIVLVFGERRFGATRGSAFARRVTAGRRAMA